MEKTDNQKNNLLSITKRKAEMFDNITHDIIQRYGKIGCYQYLIGFGMEDEEIKAAGLYVPDDDIIKKMY